jgi:hypothetical protein
MSPAIDWVGSSGLDERPTWSWSLTDSMLTRRSGGKAVVAVDRGGGRGGVTPSTTATSVSATHAHRLQVAHMWTRAREFRQRCSAGAQAASTESHACHVCPLSVAPEAPTLLCWSTGSVAWALSTAQWLRRLLPPNPTPSGETGVARGRRRRRGLRHGRQLVRAAEQRQWDVDGG